MKNGKAIDWEARLDRLEADVKEIKAMLQAATAASPIVGGSLPTTRYSTKSRRLAQRFAKKKGKKLVAAGQKKGTSQGSLTVAFLLDTDHFSILQREVALESRILRNRLDPIPIEEVKLSIISFQEQTQG